MNKQCKWLFVLLMVIDFSGYSQTLITENKLNLSFSGFVKNDFIYDSRRNVEAVDGLYTLWPLKPQYDANGKDINAQSSARMFSISSRFGTRLSGLEIGKVKVNAYLEIDFTGGDPANSIRFRHGYAALNWPKSQLLVGRTWHPSFIEKVFPGVMALNTGVPFQVFNRSEQIRFTHHINPKFDMIAAAIYQINYISFGPEGASSRYQRDAVIPNLHFQLQYFDDNWVMGAGFDWKTIQPRSFTIGNDGKTYVTNEKLSGIATIAYLKFTKNKFMLKAKSMFGQNVAESLLPGGYAVVSLNAVTGFATYTPTNHLFSWVNLQYGEIWKVALFAGYMKNMGTSVNPAGTFFARGADVDNCYRVAPQLSWKCKNFLAL